MQQLGVTYKFLGGSFTFFKQPSVAFLPIYSQPTVIAVTVVEAEMFVVGAGVV